MCHIRLLKLIPEAKVNKLKPTQITLVYFTKEAVMQSLLFFFSPFFNLFVESARH